MRHPTDRPHPVDSKLVPDAPAAAKRSWHRLYYALGAYNVVRVLVAIALGYAAMAGFSTSVDVNARWAAGSIRTSDPVTRLARRRGADSPPATGDRQSRRSADSASRRLSNEPT